MAMNWGVQTDNLPAYQELPQMPSPQRAERYQGATPAPGAERSASGQGSIVLPGTPGAPSAPGLPAPPTAPTMPGYPDMPDFEVPDYPDIPEWEAPPEPEYPEFEEPERPSERRYVQEAAAPGIREARRARAEAFTSIEDYSQNPVVKAKLMGEVLRGHGAAFSQVMGMAREVGGAKAERIYRGRFETARIDHQGQMTQARDAYQTSIMESQANWQTAAQAVRDQWQAGVIGSQAEYAAEIDARKSEWQAETQLLRDQYQMDYAKYQGELQIALDKIMYNLQKSRKRRGGPQRPIASMAMGGRITSPTYKVGEEGPELVKYDDGDFELVGTRGPEIRTFAEEGTVIPAPQTNRMLKSMSPPISRQRGGKVKPKIAEHRWMPSMYAEMAGFVPRGAHFLSRSMIILQSEWEREQERQNKLAIALAR